MIKLFHSPRFIERTLALLLAFVVVASCHACPTCKDGIANDGGNMVAGYGWSIVFMMSMPFLILTCMGGYFYLLVRQARNQATTLTTASPLEVADPDLVAV